MENQSTIGNTPHKFQDRRKRKNRYLNTLIHDRTLYWLGTDTLVKRGDVKLVIQAQSFCHGEESIIAQSVARWFLQTFAIEKRPLWVYPFNIHKAETWKRKWKREQISFPVRFVTIQRWKREMVSSAFRTYHIICMNFWTRHDKTIIWFSSFLHIKLELYYYMC